MTISPVDVHVLDAPALSSLRGPHASLGCASGRASRYDPAITPFTGLPLAAGPDDWAHLAVLVGAGNEAVLFGVPDFVPDWEPTFRITCHQMIGTALSAMPDPESVVLTPDDVPEMLDLVAQTRPGPFTPRTIELGRYLGLRRDGALVAMAGERMHPPGWTEISAVCTHPAYRGQGLGGRLIQAVAVGAHERGEGSYLHSVATNADAVRLYTSLGFEIRRQIDVAGFTVPPGVRPASSGRD